MGKVCLIDFNYFVMMDNIFIQFYVCDSFENVLLYIQIFLKESLNLEGSDWFVIIVGYKDFIDVCDVIKVEGNFEEKMQFYCEMLRV